LLFAAKDLRLAVSPLDIHARIWPWRLEKWQPRQAASSCNQGRKIGEMTEEFMAMKRRRMHRFAMSILLLA